MEQEIQEIHLMSILEDAQVIFQILEDQVKTLFLVVAVFHYKATFKEKHWFLSCPLYQNLVAIISKMVPKVFGIEFYNHICKILIFL